MTLARLSTALRNIPGCPSSLLTLTFSPPTSLLPPCRTAFFTLPITSLRLSQGPRPRCLTAFIATIATARTAGSELATAVLDQALARAGVTDGSLCSQPPRSMLQWAQGRSCSRRSSLGLKRQTSIRGNSFFRPPYAPRLPTFLAYLGSRPQRHFWLNSLASGREKETKKETNETRLSRRSRRAVPHLK